MKISLSHFDLTEEILKGLETKLRSLPRITPLSEDFEFSSLLTSYGILREVGSPNNEIARFVFDADKNEVVPSDSLRGKIVCLGKTFGVEIECSLTDRLEVKAYGVRELLHPDYSFHEDGTIKKLVIFPEAVAKIASLQNITLVIVKDWAMNTIFGGFDPQKGYYQTNFWELENNDTLLFSGLIKNRQIAFLGTHDFIAHVANVNESKWDDLVKLAERVERLVRNLISTTKTPTMASLILPYTAGVILDDLAQPPSYGSLSHQVVLEEVLNRIEDASIPSDLPSTLSRFPKSFEKVILLSRSELNEESLKRDSKILIEEMTQEIKESLVFEGIEESSGERLFSKLRKKVYSASKNRIV